MKRLYLLCIFLGIFFHLFAQIETNYYPDGSGFKVIEKQLNIKEDHSKIYSLERPDIESILIEDEEHYKDHPGCYRYGRGIAVNYTLNDGEWKEVKDGRVWVFTLESEGALSLDFEFRDLILSDDAIMYIINKEKTMLYGPVTKPNVPEASKLLTDAMTGPSSTIYLFEPTSQKNKCSLTLSTIVYGYRDSNVDIYKSTRASYLNHIDVACKPAWLFEADAVGLLKLQESANNTIPYAYGSGALVMTTNNSFAPYFLTAEHNISMNVELPYKTIKFFHRNTSCEDNIYYGDITYNNVSLLASWYDTDMALLYINDQNFGQDQRHVWLGWDRSGNTPTSGAAIHHPAGHIMKISIENNTFTKEHRTGTSVKRFWGTSWDEGYIEPGSSGAPLLDQNRRVVGQIFTTDSKSGMFHLSWTGGGTSSTRLSDWLDPIGSGQNTTNSKRQHNPEIIGPTTICQNSTASYTLTDLPPNSTVIWYLSPDYFGPTAPSGVVSGTTCTITNTCQMSCMGTLIADIMWNGSLLIKLKHPYICYSDFYGQYTSGNLSGTIDYTHIFYVKPGFSTVISSPSLKGATASYSSSGTTPLYFSLDPTQGQLQFTMPTSNNGIPVVINVEDVCGNQFQLYAMPQNSYYLIISYEGSNINISLNEDGDALRSSSIDQPWSYEIRSATRGELKMSGTVNSRSTTISTAGWPKGIYIIKATIGKEETTEKIIVR